MAKLDLSDIASGFATTTLINANNARTEVAVENTLSRDGTGPNQMESSLDMNGNLILNQANPITVEGFNWEGPWITATAYQIGDVVEHLNSSYIAIVNHTSGVFATDLAASKWQIVASSAALPAQAGNSGKLLTTDGSNASWTGTLPTFATSGLATLASISVAGAASFATGPTAPTAVGNTSTTQVATTAFVMGQEGGATPLVEGVGSAGSSHRWANDDHVHPRRDLDLITRVGTSAGTSIVLFSSIPTWVRRITLTFSQVSTNGTSPVLVQLGDSGGLENAGYTAGYGNNNTAGTAGAAVTSAGFILPGITTGDTRSGTLILNLQDSASNLWVASGVFFVVSTGVGYCAGDKPLSAILTQIGITTVGGVNTFDNGSIGAIYE